MIAAVPATSFAQTAFQAADVMNFSTGEVTTGAMTLSRSANSVQVRGTMAGLEKKSVYSVWWIIFNNAGFTNFSYQTLGDDNVDRRS